LIYFGLLNRKGGIKDEVSSVKLAIVVLLANLFSYWSGRYFLHLLFPMSFHFNPSYF
jgi:hypothetical protein